jgi:hypothetical protein
MKAILLAAALMLVGTQAHASWAEGANKQYPVFTGTNAALARAQAVSGGYYGGYRRHYVRRPYLHRRYERW